MSRALGPGRVHQGPQAVAGKTSSPEQGDQPTDESARSWRDLHGTSPTAQKFPAPMAKASRVTSENHTVRGCFGLLATGIGTGRALLFSDSLFRSVRNRSSSAKAFRVSASLLGQLSCQESARWLMGLCFCTQTSHWPRRATPMTKW
jgi:hypothetical protein